jgi:hypothetical protein
MVRSLGPHVDPLVEEGMTTFLSKHPKFLDMFMNKSLIHENPDAMIYLKAIGQNFTSDFDKWTKLCRPAKMYVIV